MSVHTDPHDELRQARADERDDRLEDTTFLLMLFSGVSIAVIIIVLLIVL